MADEREKRVQQEQRGQWEKSAERPAAEQHCADRRPTAFEDAVYGRRGWGLTRGDALFALLTVAAAVALCAVLWVGYGVRGIPGLPASAGDTLDAGVSGGPNGLDGAAGTFGTAAPGDAPEGALVAVVQNTRGFYQVLPLDIDACATVESDLGTNVVEVANGRVRCLESDCANQVCVDTGWVATAGSMIVCLPHELTVQVVADAADAAPLV